MILWIAMAVLAAAASVPVLMALTRARSETGGPARPAVAIYRDQLEEIDRDAARGLMGETEAEAARTEIARRLIHAGGEGQEASAPATGRTAVRVATIAVVAAPVAALGLYLAIGAPQMPGQPLAARLAAPPMDQDMGALIARVEAHLTENPDDGEGWDIIAPVYLRFGQYDSAIRAFASALGLLGPSAEREYGLGESITRLNGGVVTDQAKAAFERARELDPNDPWPRFFLAIALGQEGRQEEAIAAWRELLDGAPPDQEWVQVGRGELAKLTGTDEPPTPGAAAAAADQPPAPGIMPSGPNPSAEDVAAAAAMTPEDRMAMIEGMVASLAARLESDPGDAEGWARLVRSYMVLERPANAKEALTHARLALAGDADKLAVVEDTARTMGVAAPPVELPASSPDTGRVAPSPDAAQVEAGAKLAPQDRLAMIQGMVASLAARLESDPGDAEGWARLVRSYVVLDRPADAEDALTQARLALAGDADKLAVVEETARAMGVAP